MLECFFPKKYYNSIYDIPFKDLHKKNIKGIIFDIDNTLAPFDIKYPDEKTQQFFKALKKEGFKSSLVSNNKESRVKAFNSKLHLPYVARAGKPRLKGIKKAMALMKTDIHSTAFVGDQAFTDIWAGNRAGMYTILVKPVCQRDEWTVRLKRGLEKQVLKIYFRGQKNGMCK